MALPPNYGTPIPMRHPEGGGGVACFLAGLGPVACGNCSSDYQARIAHSSPSIFSVCVRVFPQRTRAKSEDPAGVGCQAHYLVVYPLLHPSRDGSQITGPTPSCGGLRVNKSGFEAHKRQRWPNNWERFRITVRSFAERLHCVDFSSSSIFFGCICGTSWEGHFRAEPRSALVPWLVAFLALISSWILFPFALLHPAFQYQCSS